nr:zf-HC2 domain-containing protein [uncultured Aminipila sp.]
MTCLEVQEFLSAYIDNELDEEIKKEIQEHINKCAQCRKDVQELKIVIAELSSLEDVPVPEAFHKRLHEALVVEGKNIKNSKASTMNKKKRINWKRIYSMAAVFLVGLFSVILYNNNLDEFNKENLNYNYVSHDKAETKEDSQTNDTMLKENNQIDGNSEHSTSSDKTNTPPKGSVDNSQTFSTDKSSVEESPAAEEDTVNELRNAPKQAEAPLNSGESQILKSVNIQDTNEELNSYLKQLDELLIESNYEVNSYTKNDDDNMWMIDVTISTTDSEGKEIKENAVYCGQDGKIWKNEL